jgi:hypothetical protein
MQYSVYNKNSLFVLSDNKELHNALYKGIGGRYYSKLKGGAGWIIPKANEPQLIKLIELNTIKDHARGDKNRHKYHRATSDSEDEDQIIDGGPGTYPCDKEEKNDKKITARPQKPEKSEENKALAYYKRFSKSPSVSSASDRSGSTSEGFPDPDKYNKSPVPKKKKNYPPPPPQSSPRYYEEDRRPSKPESRYYSDRRYYPEDRPRDRPYDGDHRYDRDRPYHRDQYDGDRYDGDRYDGDRYDRDRPGDRYDRRYYQEPRRYDEHMYTSRQDTRNRYSLTPPRPLPPLRRR